jgi:hypothetical protein
MRVASVFVSALLSLGFAGHATAASSTPGNITASTCVDPSGYSSCYGDANLVAEKCLSDAGTDETVQAACGCVLYLDEIDCAAQSCWNQVRVLAHPDIMSKRWPTSILLGDGERDY